MTILVTDACSVINFAASGDMDVLKSGLSVRTPRCTQAVDAELRKWVHNFPGLRPLLDEGWLGEPIELTRVEDRTDVGRIRTALGGTRNEPTLHLGEAESIHAMLTRVELAGAVLLTDDRDASRMAGRRSLTFWDTTRLLADIHFSGDLEWDEAQQILQRMDQADRGVRIPASYQEFIQG
ncbi:hypothetical protein ACKI1J_17395 [Streptomyces scabiei]|uniref:PIN domain-containing protein n=1 Tax=Streptomyces niveiscabiei TaxID=164115 RepID=A0ABW9HY04_9ACTN|nr:hypothetical protein [Streptomyces europaeiscabiei]MDX3866460.1 hypothetical protein [Streptomyces europaeiscabiei]MDX3874455.1 hypothetical protein [Streptomyces europaeiscabiei]WSZ19065.1 hypothetical protein OH837_39970 [Streptomyces canus]